MSDEPIHLLYSPRETASNYFGGSIPCMFSRTDGLQDCTGSDHLRVGCHVAGAVHLEMASEPKILRHLFSKNLQENEFKRGIVNWFEDYRTMGYEVIHRYRLRRSSRGATVEPDVGLQEG